MMRGWLNNVLSVLASIKEYLYDLNIYMGHTTLEQTLQGCVFVLSSQMLFWNPPVINTAVAHYLQLLVSCVTEVGDHGQRIHHGVANLLVVSLSIILVGWYSDHRQRPL